MQAFFARIAAMQLAAKVGVLIGAVAFISAGYWYFVYSDMQDDKVKLEQKQAKLRKEKDEYVKRKAEYLKYLEERQQLLEEQQEAVKKMPSGDDDDIEQFIENMQAQVELSGLTKVTSVRDPAVPMDMYERIPIRMSLVGQFHQINRFFKNVGKLPRIVNIEDLSLSPAENAPAGLNAPNLLKATFVATTFKFTAGGRKSVGATKPPPTALKAGGNK